MKYPLIINGSVSGSLTLEQDGLYTVVEAECPENREELVRLWIHGNGKCAYLGVMQPWSGGLYFRRRLSRSEAARFPPVEYASDTGCDGKTEERSTEVSGGEDPAEPQEESGDLLWLSRPDGTLTAHDGVSSLVAIPAELRRETKGTVIKRMNGRSYMIFRY